MNVSSKKASWAWAWPSFLRGRDERIVISYTTLMRRLASGSLLILRALPLSPQKTLLECSIYGTPSRRTNITRLELESAKTEVEREIKQLEMRQKPLLDESSGFESCESPKPLRGHSTFVDDDFAIDQDELHDILAQHLEQERHAGREIHPAARKQSFTREGMADDDCKQPFHFNSVLSC